MRVFNEKYRPKQRDRHSHNRQRDLRGEERGDVVHAVAVVVGGHQLEHGELAALGGGQVNGQTQACGGGEGHPQPVALPGGPPPAFTRWHVLQHVRLHQAGLLL